MPQERARQALHGRTIPPGNPPFINCEGTAREAGVMLGCAWKEALTLGSQRRKGRRPWWKDKRIEGLVSRYAPHLPELYRGMAEGAGLGEGMVGPSATLPESGSCTSFAVTPDVTLDGVPLSGQNKDTSVTRGMQLQVLRLSLTDAPSMLTLTYAGELFGHGFVEGGTAITRNSLYVPAPAEGLPYATWGILALHCPKVETVEELTRRHGVREVFHVTVADEEGAVMGIENGEGGPAFLEPADGIYVHANAILSGEKMREHERDDPTFTRSGSHRRVQRLRARLGADSGRLTPQLAYMALSDHHGYPASICRHQSREASTTASVLFEPTRGLLHTCRGAPCQSWLTTFSLWH